MRPLRLVLALSASLVAILFLSYFAASGTGSGQATQGSGSLGTYFNWQSSSLFPPSAIISLTDDNSTFFIARPANFGPTLPSKGLKGQLWIGSGFGDDNLSRGGVASAEGELGCSDVPGWGNGDHANGPAVTHDAAGTTKSSTSGSKAAEAKANKSKRRDTGSDGLADTSPEQRDGTDDHLHHPLPASNGLKSSSDNTDGAKKLAHADIQSLQESAEIAGKVVLLARGGCGFLEKVKWVQRRGGVGLIVGDNVRGGTLVTMYARGDTSNVTIPSLFTSHMTAHLLSSLVPSGGYLEDIDPNEAARLGLALGDKSGPGGATKSEGKQQKSSSGNTNDKTRADSSNAAKSSEKLPLDTKVERRPKQGWLDSILGGSVEAPHHDTRRPPSSGKIDWVQQKDFEDEKPSEANSRSGKYTSSSSSKTPENKVDPGFVIGIQDWRDPDLLDAQLEAAQNPQGEQKQAGETRPTTLGGLKGGSITPGSGEYDQTHSRPADGKASSKDSAKSLSTSKADQDKQDVVSHSWLGRLGLSSKEPHHATPDKSASKAAHVVTQVGKKPSIQADQLIKDDDDKVHEGLWVTLTPTSMSSSPFFDTLLVLVVSPLVTLTIVYALLLLRSRIRRRRWRAPKSVVDRLPVRTYHTVPSTTGSNSPSESPPRSPAAATSTTPLLHSGARSISQGAARPRARTASEIPEAGSSFRGTTNSSIDAAQEKREAGLAEWRRRYVGRQKECVVCLEDYVDGVSRVMSLPCGHEFHAECISPWLTTRRRTCPICKSDVVRSIARSGASLSAQPLLLDTHYSDSEDEAVEDLNRIQEQAAGIRNEDPASAEPINREEEAFEDLERGLGDDDHSR